jgi:hypothetical protein
VTRPDPAAAVLSAATEWASALTDERCTCGLRVHRTPAEVALYGAVERWRESVARKSERPRFDREAKTVPKGRKR